MGRNNSGHKRKGLNEFPYDLDFTQTDFRQHPELYRIGRGEQGVLMVQPYKSEILPHWRFKTPELARESAEKIWGLFEEYLDSNDFVGADMARKYLQMGFTRARRYANHASGRKYQTGDHDANKGKYYPYTSGSKHRENPILPQEKDAYTSEKAESARIFKDFWDRARDEPRYQQQKEEFRAKYYSK